MNNIQHEQTSSSMSDLDTIFTHFSTQDIEEFYELYQLWSLKQKRPLIVAQIHELTRQIAENEAYLKAVSPSTIALATLSQFRASGVDDIDLLDRMLERGDVWLDHTLQLFERCESLDMIQGNATEWCEHALEGAYEWIESMGGINEQSADDDNTIVALSTPSSDQPLLEEEFEALPETTEADFLQKLMSEDGEPQTQPEESLPANEQQTTSDTQIEVEPAISVNSTDQKNEEEDTIPPNIDVDELFSQENSVDEIARTEAIQVEPQDDTTAYDLAQAEEDEEIDEYAIPDALPEIQEETEQIETSLPNKEAHIQPDEQEDTIPEQVDEHEEVEYAIPDALPEIQEENESTEEIQEESKPTEVTQEESEPTEVTGDDQTQNLSPTEQDNLDQHLVQEEDSTPEVKTEEITETPFPQLNEPDTEDIPEEEVFEPQEGERRPDEEGETQQIRSISLQPANENIEAPLSEQAPTHITTDEDYSDELISSFDEQAGNEQTNEEPIDKDRTQPLRRIKVAPPVPASSPDTDSTRSSAEVDTETTNTTNTENEQAERAEYVREVAFAEAASELENNTLTGLPTPDIADIPSSASNNEVSTPLEENRSDIQHQTEKEIQKTQVQSGQQDRGKKKKPQKQKQAKPRGFLRRLLAKLLHWR